MQKKLTDKQILESYKKHQAIGKMAHDLDVPHITIWRRAQKLNLKFPGIGSGKKLELSEILEGKHPQYPTIKLSRRLKKERILEDKCDICDITEWNGNPIVLQLDHKNGKRTDHRLENLRLLCPNCHSQTENFCGRNKKKT